MAVGTKAPLAVKLYQTAVWDFKEQPYNIPEEREKVFNEGFDDHPQVKANDRVLLKNLKDYITFTRKYYTVQLNFNPIEDDPTQPLEKWWWHLNKIVKGEYPIEKLPEHLREIYRERYL